MSSEECTVFTPAGWKAWRPRWVAVVLLLTMVGPPAARGEATAATTNKPAVLKISGYGILGNRELKRMLRTLDPAAAKTEFFGPAFVEDAALLLENRVTRDGFLTPRIEIRLRLDDGRKLQVFAGDLLDNPLPRPLRIKKANFRIRKGVLFYYQRLEFEGLTALPEKQARDYFLETETLFRLKRNKVYTPDRLKRGIASMTEILERMGYAQAKSKVTRLEVNERTGAADVRIRFEEGPKFLARSVQQEFYFEKAEKPSETKTVHPDKPYSRLWLQDYMLAVKTNLYRNGYPDADVEVKTVQGETNLGAGRVELDLAAVVRSGSYVRVGEVTFKGHRHTRRSLLSRRVRVQRGDLLDPIRVEEGRARLAELGIFEKVDFEYEPVDEHLRNIEYELKEARKLNLSLLFGWGSYEMLRGGIEAQALNIWGLAHHARLKGIQSFKSTLGEFTYTVPELVGRDVDLFLHASGLRREEVDFTRLEYGGGVGAHKYFKSLALDGTVRYRYEILSALHTVRAVESEGLIEPTVGAIITDLKLDRRDNPLYPRKGYKIFTSFETASEMMGGDANYQRVELSPAWHKRLGSGLSVGVGLSHGIAIPFGSAAGNLPFNRRFFPGGDNSIRGYQEGEASPRNEDGDFVGAETFTLGVVELEQALTRQWSLVVFGDALGYARRIDDYPFDAGLYAMGGGIRWRTLIGPVRLEYAHNLNPRDGDPSGTLHFSLGFPF